MWRVKEYHQMWNRIDTLINKKHFKEYKKEDINIMKEEYGILIIIHGKMDHQTNINKLSSDTNNDYKLEKLQQKYMESKEIKLFNN